MPYCAKIMLPGRKKGFFWLFEELEAKTRPQMPIYKIFIRTIQLYDLQEHDVQEHPV